MRQSMGRMAISVFALISRCPRIVNLFEHDIDLFFNHNKTKKVALNTVN